jgi:hypothetical protein
MVYPGDEHVQHGRILALKKLDDGKALIPYQFEREADEDNEVFTCASEKPPGKFKENTLVVWTQVDDGSYVETARMTVAGQTEKTTNCGDGPAKAAT